MTVKTEAARGTLTYSRMRGMVAILIAFMKQRRMGLNDFIQKIANNSYACKHPEVQSILKISQPQEPELMNANPSPPPSPSQQINLGPSSNPHAKPSDFHFLKVIGKGSFGKVISHPKTFYNILFHVFILLSLRNTAEMYDNILNKPLQLKPNITNSARHLLEGLLQKDRTKRLGAKDDFMEIKNHVFFSLINWDDLINKKITPPFNPNVSGPSDLRHFDPEFTEEPVPNSIGRSPDSILITASVKEAAEAFLGFSYAPPMDSFL
uniref:AGC-kinase C-terminal domain-containing protein n=1 Tax=Urocitellus parryii TaxID=9999 RepID=A0A8D2KCN0_UROPR